MDFSKSRSTTTTTSFFDSDSEEDDFLRVGRGRISSGSGLRPGRSTGSSLSPSFGTWNSSFNDHAELCNHRNGWYDRTSLIPKITQIIEENEKSVVHAVEVASASVTQLDSRTRRLANSVDDLKVSVEYSHGRTAGKLRQLESILKEVHMDVKALLDKQEIAETELRLLKGHRYRTELPERKTQNLDVQTALSQQKPCISSGESYQSGLASHTSAQPVSVLFSAYANLPHLNDPPRQAPVVPSTLQPLLEHMPPFLTQAPELSSPSPPESYRSTLVHHQALSASEVLNSHLPPFSSPKSQYTPNRQHIEPYANSLSYFQQSLQPAESGMEQEQPTLYSFRVSHLPQNSSFSGFPDPSRQKSHDEFAFHSEGSPVKSSLYSPQVLPNALPKASFLDTQSDSSGKVNKAPNEDIVEEVTAMGFRRDMVIAAVRKLTQNQESVDLNTLLDKLMN